MTPPLHPQQGAHDELVDAAEWLLSCHDDVLHRRPCTGYDEAWVGLAVALARVHVVDAEAGATVRLDDVVAALRRYDHDVQKLGWEDAVGEHPADTVLRSFTTECQAEGCSERTTGIYCGAHVVPMTGTQEPPR